MKLSYLTLDNKGEEEFRTFYIDKERICGFGDIAMEEGDDFKLINLSMPSGFISVKYDQDLIDYLMGCGRFD